MMKPIVRSLVRRAPRPVRTRLYKLRKRLRPPQPVAKPPQPRPAVSIILPIYNVESYLAHCLDSILAQGFRNFELIVVDDGSPDDSYAIAKRYAAKDSRIRIVRRPNGGLGAARNTGVRRARGRYLMFVDSDDALTLGSLGPMVRSARRSGADIVVGAAVRFTGRRRWTPEWVHELHAKSQIGITLEDFPRLVRNNYTWGKLYRRSFWKAQGLEFREGVAYEDQPIITQLYARAAKIDVLSRVVYRYRARADGSSISQQTSTVADLRDRVAAWRVSDEALSGSVSPTIYQAWLQTLFDAHFHWYLNSPAVVSAEYWRELQSAVAELAARAPRSVWEQTMPMRRVMIELARRNRQLETREFIARSGHRIHLWPSTCTPEGLYLHLPYFDDPELDLDRELFLLRPEQLELSHSVQSLTWQGDAELLLTGWAYIRYLNLAEAPEGTTNVVTLVARHRSSGRSFEFANQHHPAPPFPAPNDDPWADYEGGQFSVRVPFAALSAEVGATIGDVWDLNLRVEVAGLVVTAPITRVNQRGSAAALEHTRLADDTHLVLLWQWRRPLRVRLDEAGLELIEAAVEDRLLTGVLRGDLTNLTAIEATNWPARMRARTELVPTDSGQATVSLALPELPARLLQNPAATLRWRVRAILATGTKVPVTWRVDALSSEDRGEVVALERTRYGRLTITERRGEVVATHLAANDQGKLELRGRFAGTVAPPFRLAFVHPTRRSDWVVPEIDGTSFSATVPMARTEGRFGTLPLRAGDYRLVADVPGVQTGTEEGAQFPVLMSPALLLRVPIVVDSPLLQATLVRGGSGNLQVSVKRPLGPEATGRYRQNLLRAPRPDARASHRGLLLQSYFGESATDNGVGLQAELTRRGADLPVYWAVRDYSVPVPEGGIPVIKDSAEWYRLLSGVTYYMDNMYQPDYHIKPAGQVLMQTFHGYPFKTMGYPNWIRAGFSTRRIDSYARRSAEWDYLISPAPYATPLLNRDFRYFGEVLEIGYPRNDVLSSPESDELRRRVRDAFGIKPDQTVVLYAPTYRDYLSPDDHRAEMVNFLDLDAVTAALGDGYVVLVRGHAFNARVNRRIRPRPGVIDVTDYPEVTDLYLAADAGLVDYSSLRFDFGVTGKPMIFHVPDLQRYVETRGWLFDFEPTAPGPFVNTTEEILDALLNLDEVRAEYADTYQQFRDDYLTLEDGHAAARLVDAVFVPRGDAPAAEW